MSDNKMGAYHLANNPALYEVARSNNFEFVVTGLGSLLRAGANTTDNNAYINGTTAMDVIRMSVESSSVPTFKQSPMSIRKGNSVMKFAGLPEFNEGRVVVRDFIGADTKSALMAWQNLSYNVKTQKVGQMKDYKKDCYLMEYTPDMQLIRTWELKGCWIAGLEMPEFSQEQGDKRTITVDIPYDYAIMSLPEEEE